MLPNSRTATATVTPKQAVLDGGLDMISPPGYAKPGTVRFGLNYELEFGGGYRRLGGFERYDGRFQPHLAAYAAMQAAAPYSGVVVGNTVTGLTSGATGRVIYVQGDLLAVTRVAGGPFVNEILQVAAVTVGTVIETEPEIDGFLDNELEALAAESYRPDILKPAGGGPIRGVAVLNNVVYCWRDSAVDLAATLVTYKATPGGWVVVPLFHQISFNGGSTVYAEGSTLTQGGASATVKRVVVESGSWLAGTAAGRLIIAPIGGAFVAGAAAGGGVVNLLGAAAQITMAGFGRVDSVVYNFTANLATRRLYCCDGINPEWEFDGTVLVPLNTGMGSIRATRVIAHKNHLFFSYRSSLQHSGTGEPYKWAPLFGAGELGAGDDITNVVPASGSEAAAALMVLCKDSAWVLYGSDADTWQFVRVSEEAGAQVYGAQEMGGALAFDRDGLRRYLPTQSFGNFDLESVSRNIEPLVKNATIKCTVLSKNRNQARFHFADGLFVTGTPLRSGFGWMACDYGRVIECAVGAEIDGTWRIFMGDADGWVLEADVGRSFDGEVVPASLRLNSQNQGSSVTLKQYRNVEIESLAESAFALAVAAEFSDSDPDAAAVNTVDGINTFRQQYGAGLFWDFNSWDRAYWDVSQVSRVRYPVRGQGRSISLLVQSESANEMPHTLKSHTILLTARRMVR